MVVPTTRTTGGLVAWHYLAYAREQSPRDRAACGAAEQSARQEHARLWRDADLPVGIDERHLARAIVDEEIERIDRVDLGRELDQHVELGDRLRGLNVTRATRLPCGSRSQCRRCSGSTTADSSQSARACDRLAATGSAGA